MDGEGGMRGGDPLPKGSEGRKGETDGELHLGIGMFPFLGKKVRLRYDSRGIWDLITALLNGRGKGETKIKPGELWNPLYIQLFLSYSIFTRYFFNSFSTRVGWNIG